MAKMRENLRYPSFYALDLVDIGVDDRRILDMNAGKVYRNKRHVLPEGRRWSLEPMFKQRSKYAVQGMMNEHGENLTIGEVIHGQVGWVQLAMDNIQGYIVRIVVKERVAYLEEQIMGASGAYEALARVLDWEPICGQEMVMGALHCDACGHLPYLMPEPKGDGLIDTRLWAFNRLQALDLLLPTAKGLGFMEALCTVVEKKLPAVQPDEAMLDDAPAGRKRGRAAAGRVGRGTSASGMIPHPGPEIDAAAWAAGLLPPPFQPMVKQRRVEHTSNGGAAGVQQYDGGYLAAAVQNGLGRARHGAEDPHGRLAEDQALAMMGGQHEAEEGSLHGGGWDGTGVGNGGDMLMAAAAAANAAEASVRSGTETLSHGAGGLGGSSKDLTQLPSSSLPSPAVATWPGVAPVVTGNGNGTAAARNQGGQHPVLGGVLPGSRSIPKGPRSNRGSKGRRTPPAMLAAAAALVRASSLEPAGALPMYDDTTIAAEVQPEMAGSDDAVYGGVDAAVARKDSSNVPTTATAATDDPIGSAIAPHVERLVRHLVDSHTSGTDPDAFNKTIQLFSVLPLGTAALKHVLPQDGEAAEVALQQMLTLMASSPQPGEQPEDLTHDQQHDVQQEVAVAEHVAAHHGENGCEQGEGVPASEDAMQEAGALEGEGEEHGEGLAAQPVENGGNGKAAQGKETQEEMKGMVETGSGEHPGTVLGPGDGLGDLGDGMEEDPDVAMMMMDHGEGEGEGVAEGLMHDFVAAEAGQEDGADVLL